MRSELTSSSLSAEDVDVVRCNDDIVGLTLVDLCLAPVHLFSSAEAGVDLNINHAVESSRLDPLRFSYKYPLVHMLYGRIHFNSASTISSSKVKLA